MNCNVYGRDWSGLLGGVRYTLEGKCAISRFYRCAEVKHVARSLTGHVPRVTGVASVELKNFRVLLSDKLH
jgi:hypothetical protein